MIVQTEFNTYDNVNTRPDGSWVFTWNDEDGKEQVVTYAKHNAEKFVATGDWKVLTPVGKQKVDLARQDLTLNFAAAFNMWLDQYVNDPQSFESSYDTAMRHVSEKLGGNEPSYGQVAAEQFKQYLNQLESK